MSNLPNPYFHSPMNRYPTAPPDAPPAWATAPEGPQPDGPPKSRLSRVKLIAIAVLVCVVVAALIMVLAL